MQQITIIATRHQNLGICNSENLYRILEMLNPQIIFVETPPSCYEATYEAQTHKTLETEAIIAYADHNEIEIVPVDSDDLPSREFFKAHEILLKKIEAQINQNGFDYRYLVDRHSSFIYTHGLAYLNSLSSDQNLNAINKLIENGLNIINDQKLIDSWAQWIEVHEKREQHMLNEIERFSQSRPYSQAVFTIGAGHRRGLIKKIDELNNSSLTRVEWSLYSTYSK